MKKRKTVCLVIFFFSLSTAQERNPFLISSKKRELHLKTRAPAHPPSRMIFCDKNYFFGGSASATSSKRQCSIFFEKKKKKEVSSPSCTMKGGRKKSHTHSHIPQTSEARVVIHEKKKKRTAWKEINRRQKG